jgi:hypothetical protein
VSRGVRGNALVRASERHGKERLYLFGVKAIRQQAFRHALKAQVSWYSLNETDSKPIIPNGNLFPVTAADQIDTASAANQIPIK